MWKLEGPYRLLDFDETLVCLRQGRDAQLDVSYVDGLPYAAHPPSVNTITATWQPMTGKDLLLVPEAFREENNARMWQRHYTPGAETFRVDVGDVIVRLGKAWQIKTVMDWGDYTETVCRQIDVGLLSGPIAELVTDPLTGVTTGPMVYPPAPVAP